MILFCDDENNLVADCTQGLVISIPNRNFALNTNLVLDLTNFSRNVLYFIFLATPIFTATAGKYY